MKLTIVGCAGSAPGPNSPASCYLVEHDGFRLVLDLGNGSFGTLQAVVDPDAIDAVFYFVEDDQVIRPDAIYDEAALRRAWASVAASEPVPSPR